MLTFLIWRKNIQIELSLKDIEYKKEHIPKCIDKMGREETVKMYYNFVDLNESSSYIREVVEDMQMLVEGTWNFAEELATNRMLDVFNNIENILAEVMTIQSEDNKIFLLKMAVYRFCTFHLPQIMKTIIERENEIGNTLLSVYVHDENMKQWEKGFWGNRIDRFYFWGKCESIIQQREEYRKEKPIKESDYKFSYNSYILETIQKAYEDYETMMFVEQAEKKYMSIVNKTKRRNMIMKKNEIESKYISAGIQELKMLIEIMERDLKGELTVGDFLMMKEKKEEWGKSIQNFEEIISHQFFPTNHSIV